MPRIIEAPDLKADYIIEGTHVYNPPVGEVLMDDPRSPYFERPMGFYREAGYQGYIDSSARLGGAGGGGLTLAIMLAKHGVRDFSVADLDTVDATNVGRIPMLTPDDIGRHKADLTAELIVRHNPMARVRVYRNGIQEDNVDEFLGYNGGTDGEIIGLDEIDITSPEVSLMFHRAARKFGRFVIEAVDVERGGMVTVFNPHDQHHTYEHYTGAKPSDSVDEYLRKVHGFQLPTIPNLPASGTIDTFMAVQKKAPLPTTLRSVLVATDLALDEYEKILTLGQKGYKKPHFFPKIHGVNPSRGEDFTTKHPRTRSVARIIQAVVRDSLKLNPPVSYSEEARQRREAYRQAKAAERGN